MQFNLAHKFLWSLLIFNFVHRYPFFDRIKRFFYALCGFPCNIPSLLLTYAWDIAVSMISYFKVPYRIKLVIKAYLKLTTFISISDFKASSMILGVNPFGCYLIEFLLLVKVSVDHSIKVFPVHRLIVKPLFVFSHLNKLEIMKWEQIFVFMDAIPVSA